MRSARTLQCTRRLNAIVWLGAALGMLSLTTSCRQSISRLNTVTLDQSQVLSQGNLGFCWAFTTGALLDSEWLLAGNAKVNFSPYYIAFYWQYESLLTQLKYPGLKAEDISLDEAGGVRLGLIAFEKYGIVPLEMYNPAQKLAYDGLKNPLSQWIKENITSEERRTYYANHSDEVMAALGQLYGQMPPKPDDPFTLGGVSTTARSLKDKINVKSENYQDVAMSRDNMSQVVEYIKTSIMNKHAVPIEISQVWKNAQTTEDLTFTLDPCKADSKCAMESFEHVMLVVDFVNTGGRAGAMTTAEINSVFSNPLDYLMIRNSWGSRRYLTQDGKNPGATDGGFFRMTREYLDPPQDKVDRAGKGPTFLILKDMMKNYAGGTSGGASADSGTVGGYTCQQQKDWGKCSETWMHPVCDAVCGGATGSGTTTSGGMVGSYSCQQQKDWGKCSETWMHPVCDAVCSSK